MDSTKVSQFDPNLVLWLRMQEGPNPVAFDYSGASNHGKILGTTMWSSPGLYFDGSTNSDEVDVNNSFNLDKMTVCFWMKSSDEIVNTDKFIIGTEANIGFQIIGGVLGRIRAAVRTSYVETTTHILGEDVWFFITLTYDTSLVNANVKLYVNGVLEDTADGTEPLTTTQILKVGGWTRIVPPSTNHYTGYLDDVRIYNCVQSPEWFNSTFQSTRSKYGV